MNTCTNTHTQTDARYVKQGKPTTAETIIDLFGVVEDQENNGEVTWINGHMKAETTICNISQSQLTYASRF